MIRYFFTDGSFKLGRGTMAVICELPPPHQSSVYQRPWGTMGRLLDAHHSLDAETAAFQRALKILSDDISVGRTDPVRLYTDCETLVERARLFPDAYDETTRLLWKHVNRYLDIRVAHVPAHDRLQWSRNPDPMKRFLSRGNAYAHHLAAMAHAVAPDTGEHIVYF